MTTVAIKDGVLAVDSVASRGDRLAGYVDKAVYVDFGAHKAILSGVGDMPALADFFRWHGDGCQDNSPGWLSSDDFSGLMYKNDGTLWAYERQTTPFLVRPVTNHFAFGSGCHIATGAMEAGATAEEAVRIAAMYSYGTGGKINVFRHENLIS